ncbi:13965_t:CDS:2, partial [Cetraspora pellucida]
LRTIFAAPWCKNVQKGYYLAPSNSLSERLKISNPWQEVEEWNDLLC